MTIELLQDASRRVIAAWGRFDDAEQKLRHKYLSAKPGVVEQERFAAALGDEAQRRDTEIASIRSQATRENAADEADIKRRLGRDLGKPTDAVVESAWTGRVKPRLDGGFPLAEILEAPGLSRADVEAIRANYPSYVTAKVGPSAARDATTRESIADAERQVNVAELGLLDGDVRNATTEGRQRDGAEAAMRRAMNYDTERRSGWKPTNPAANELSLAFGLASDLGVRAHEPARRDWKEIIEEIEPGANAKAQRNSLPPELRDKLDGNAADVGFGRADPQLKLQER